MSFLKETSLSRKNLLTFAAISAVSFFISLVAWALSSPLGSSPDEDFHVGSIWCADGFSTDTCEVKEYIAGASQQIVTVPDVMDLCFKRNGDQSGDCSWDPESLNPELRANDRFQYPPLFYRVMHVFVSDAEQASGLTMRLVNSLIASSLLFAAVMLSSFRVRQAAIVGFTATLVPLAIFLIPSLNPSSWAYLGVAFAWIFLMNALTGEREQKRRLMANWALFLICIIMAIGSRWDSALYVLVSATATFYLAKKLSGELKSSHYLIAKLVAAIGFVAIAIVYLPKLVNAFRNGIFGDTSTSDGWSAQNLFFHNIVHLIEIPAGIFGFGKWGIGWIDTPLPGIVSIVGISAFAFFFLQSLPFQKRQQFFVVTGLIAFTALVLLVTLTSGGIIVGKMIQPRYILPMLPLILGISIWSSKGQKPFGIDPRARAILIGTLISIAHAVSLWTNMRRYTLGLKKDQGFNLNSPIEWWWGWAPAPGFVFFLGIVSFSIFIYTAFKIVLAQQEALGADSENPISSVR